VASRVASRRRVWRPDTRPLRRVNPSGAVRWVARVVDAHGDRQYLGTFAVRGPCPEPHTDGECCAQHRIDRAYDEWYEGTEPLAPEFEQWSAPGAETRGWLYFIGPEHGHPIKVGWSTEVSRRLATLQGAHWLTLVCHGAVPATMMEEAAAHQTLGRHRVRGEWFDRPAALDLLAAFEERAASRPTPSVGEAA
jgi:hypothetical protein